MATKPILLFLHGIGAGDKDERWKVGLADALERLGYPDLGTATLISPQYAHLLKGWDEKERLPGVTIKQPVRDAARANRRDFERRAGAIEFRLGRHDRGNGQLGGDALIKGAVQLGALGVPRVAQAHNYLKTPEVRAQVLNRILSKLPESGTLVIVGYSLGSVIAADLVSRLPTGLSVAGMVTIGSPLANSSFSVDKLRETLAEPPTNLAWWVNFWNPADPVAAHRGVSSAFPWMVDFRIETKKVLLGAHEADEYLTDETVAAAIGFGLFGSRSKELTQINKGFDIPLDTTEEFALQALRYAHLISMRLEGDLQKRYAGALRQVQANEIEAIRTRNTREHRKMPSSISRLAFDLSDPDAIAPEPQPGRHLSKEEAVVLLTLLAAENVISPFEISIKKDVGEAAMRDLAAEMGLGSQLGADVFAAARAARATLSPAGVNWLKWGALGVGAAAIVATGGLALVAVGAGAGLAGAAAITTALASFGPGGMIGGLLTAGTLVTAGSGGIAFGLASPRTSAETLEAVIERRLAAEILRKTQHLEPDPGVWRVLVEIEIEVRREHERLDEISDPTAPSLKELKRKVEVVERALKYLRDNNLEPDV